MRHAGRQSESGRLPDFLGIGAQKAGTTWIYENLRRHPDVFIPDVKELHYFNRDFHEPLAHYTRHFVDAGAKVCGDITPAYGILPPERIRTIRALMPHARLILIVRDPIERAWSQAVMELAERRGRAVSDVSVEEYLAFLASDACIARSSYRRILRRWLTHYPREQLYVGRFEDIAANPRRLLSDLFRHIGVSEEVDWERFPCSDVIVPNAAGFSLGTFSRVVDASARTSLRDAAPEIQRMLARRFSGERRFVRALLAWQRVGRACAPLFSFGTRRAVRRARTSILATLPIRKGVRPPESTRRPPRNQPSLQRP